jgi:ribosome modulation factor
MPRALKRAKLVQGKEPIMKLSIRSILITGILAIGANTLLVAQTTNPWFEGWYRAKFGRPSPTEEARLQVIKANPASREATPAQSAAPANPWFEGWYRAKFGRPSPTEEARLQAEQTTAASRAEKPSQSATPVNTWFEGWYRAKYGRPSPQEEARVKAQSN